MKFFRSPIMIDKSTFFFLIFSFSLNKSSTFFYFYFCLALPFFILLFYFYFISYFPFLHPRSSSPDFLTPRRKPPPPLEYTRTFGLLPLAFCSAAKQQHKNKLFYDNHQPPPFLSC